MEVTNVRATVVPPEQRSPTGPPLHAVCSVTFDHVFVVHEVKVVGAKPFIAMPSRRAYERCGCGWKNGVDNRYCGGCGLRLHITPQVNERTGRPILFYDLAHPIEPEFRSALSDAVRRAAFSGQPHMLALCP